MAVTSSNMATVTRAQRLAPQSRSALQAGVRFGERDSGPPQPVPKRGWLKTLLLGAGTLLGLIVAGKFALSRLGGLTSQQLPKLVGDAPLQSAGASLLGKAGQWVLNGLRSDWASKYIVETITAFKAVKPYITQENLQTLLNPQTFKQLWNEVTTHKLYSVEAIKTYVGQHADDLSGVLGDNVTSILKHLFT